MRRVRGARGVRWGGRAFPRSARRGRAVDHGGARSLRSGRAHPDPFNPVIRWGVGRAVGEERAGHLLRARLSRGRPRPKLGVRARSGPVLHRLRGALLHCAGGSVDRAPQRRRLRAPPWLRRALRAHGLRDAHPRRNRRRASAPAGLVAAREPSGARTPLAALPGIPALHAPRPTGSTARAAETPERRAQGGGPGGDPGRGCRAPGRAPGGALLDDRPRRARGPARSRAARAGRNGRRGLRRVPPVRRSLLRTAGAGKRIQPPRGGRRRPRVGGLHARPTLRLLRRRPGTLATRRLRPCPRARAGAFPRPLPFRRDRRHDRPPARHRRTERHASQPEPRRRTGLEPRPGTTDAEPPLGSLELGVDDEHTVGLVIRRTISPLGFATHPPFTDVAPRSSPLRYITRGHP